MSEQNHSPKAAIVGGGIGGLTAALALARIGWRVEIFEQAPTFSEIGAGLQLSPNATRVLETLGLEDELRTKGFRPEGIEIRNWQSGQLLASEALGEKALDKWGANYFHIHRADLHELLLNSVRRYPGITFHSHAECIGVQQTADQASLILATAATHWADIVIGADGIHSRVCETLFKESDAHFTGNVAWRLLIPADRIPEGMVRPVASLWMGPGAHFVHYYVRNAEMVNCVCVVEQNDWRQESWTEHGDKSVLKSSFAGWHENIQALIDAADAEAFYRWALFDRNPMTSWSKGRITLLGDACHPTLPFLAQGAAMAIEDAMVLANSLQKTADHVQALKQYEDHRKVRTAKVQLTSRRNSRIYHMAGLMAAARNMALRSGLVSAEKTTEWLYHYDATQLP